MKTEADDTSKGLSAHVGDDVPPRSGEGDVPPAQEKDEWERYGEYFMDRSVADIMLEYGEQHDEWRN